jgi:Subtilisin inhibitor-like
MRPLGMRPLAAVAVALVSFGLSGAAGGAGARADLTITVWPNGRVGESTQWTLRCGPSGGTLPASETACTALATHDDPFDPVPPEALCGALAGGRAVALVRGTFRGQRIWTRFNRENLCQVARWDRVAFLFSPRVPSASAELKITAWPKGRGTAGVKRWTLRCGPAGGSLPNAARACRSLASLKNRFAPVPKGVACTEIYGGPAEAVVSGRYASRRVWARFSRTDGCQIDRWERHRFLFPFRTDLRD